MLAGEQVRDLAAVWAGSFQGIAREMYDELAVQIPVARADPELAALTLASCSSNVESILSMMLSGIPSSAAEAPVSALQHARLMAKRGAEVDDTLRFYRLGHGHFMRRWVADLRERELDAEVLFATIDETAAFMVEYIDIVSSRVSAEHLAERERRQQRAALVRADLVTSLLAGDVLDLSAAKLTLGHDLDRMQLGFICWSNSGSARIGRAASEVARAFGAARPLLVPNGPDALSGWLVPGTSPPDAEALRELLQTTTPEVNLALGRPGTGIHGFRRSHEQAGRARRVAEVAGTPSPCCVPYDDVALVDLLTADIAAAREFARVELRDLVAPDARPLRETLKAVLAPRGGVAQAARSQGVHRNTILQRLQRAAALRGSPVEERTDELYVALVLASLPGVVDGPPGAERRRPA